MRLFIAINFNSGTKAGLISLRDDLRACSKRGNFSVPENLHLTLVFLGECDVKQAAAVKTAMDAVVSGPFYISIEQIGRFRAGGGDIWWAGANGGKELLELQRDLTGMLTEAGFKLEKRKYSPHITLGREVVTDKSPRELEPFGETVSSIELMKSERISGKLTYTAIHQKRF